MYLKTSKHFYKVISLFIKLTLLFISLFYIWQKLKNADTKINFDLVFSASNIANLFFLIMMMLLNWSAEAIKWKLLISKLERISFEKSFASVLAGISLSIFTPNRVGEFAGRIFYLEKADRVKASISSVLGSMMQLSVTILGGIIAYYILDVYYLHFFGTVSFISLTNIILLLISMLLFAVLIAYLYSKRNNHFLKYLKYIKVLNYYSKPELGALFALSLFRYIIFSIQYYIILKLFGINAGPIILISLIALTFFITSAIPTFALTEIAVRTATAVFFIGTISTNSNAIISSSLFLWIINLGLPAIAGSVFVWKMKIFKK